MDKNLAQILKEYKTIKPLHEWKENNRSVLINQIYGTEKRATEGFIWKDVLYKKLPLQILRNISQPVMVVFLVLIFAMIGSVVSVRVAHNTKPGDSLYVAKIFGEKTQKALTFNKKQKAKLSIEFAGNRVDEINSLLASNKNTNGVAVERLMKEAKNELSKAKQSIIDIQNKDNTNVDNTDIDDNLPEEKVEVVEDGLNGGKEEAMVFSANLTKDQKGMQISGVENPGLEEAATSTENLSDKESTSTESIKEESQEGEVDAGENDIFAEVVDLIENDKYDEVLDRLNDVDNIIDGSDVEHASSSEAIDDEAEGDTEESEDVLNDVGEASSSESVVE